MKLLIIRFSSIGDIVLTTPIIRCVKNQIENSEVHYLTNYSFGQILQNNPYIDKLHLLRDSHREIISELRKEKFDYIIDLHRNTRSFLVKKSLFKKSYTFNKLNWEKWLIVNFKINKLPDKHIVDRYFESVSKLNVHNDGKGLDYFISEKDKENILKLFNNINNDFIAIGLGGYHNTKKFPNDKLIALCKEIKYPIVFLGGKAEYPDAEEISNLISTRVYNYCGQLSLNESAAILKLAYKVISNDTGVMHIAAAFKKEIISIWGNTIPEFGMFPYFGHQEDLYSTNSHIIEIKDLSCRPCSKLGYNKCPKRHFRCMRGIDENIILNWIN